MATAKRDQPAQHKVAQHLLAQHLLGIVNEALKLVHRFREVPGFRAYVLSRLWLVLPIGFLMIVTSIGCAAATVLYLGGTRPLLVLLAMLLVPFVLLGSVFVQAYVFFSWLESRALAQALHRGPPARGPVARWLRQNLGAEMGAVPPVPWIPAAIFLLLPLAMLVMLSPAVGLALILLHVLAPIAFARLER